jgi:hypothetical protein
MATDDRHPVERVPEMTNDSRGNGSAAIFLLAGAGAPRSYSQYGWYSQTNQEYQPYWPLRLSP